MTTVSDSFNRINTSQGDLGSTDTGNLPWQGTTQWNINSNAANNTQATDVAWVEIPNSDAEVGIETGAGSAKGNGVGAAFWVKDADDFWIAYVWGERYQDGTTCVGGYYECTSCTACGGGNVNPVTWTVGQTNSFVTNVGCGCSGNSHGACSCDGSGTPSRAGGSVTETEIVCGSANCEQPSGTNSEICDSNQVTNPTTYNSPTPGNQKGGNINNQPCATYFGPATNSFVPGNPRFVKNGTTKNGASIFSPAGTNPYTSVFSPGICRTYNTNYNAYSYNAPSPGTVSGGGNTKTVYNCSSGGNSFTGSCSTATCTPASGNFTCGNLTCSGTQQSCTSCGTTGVESTITCTCTQGGGNTNACITCVPTSGAECYNACLTTTPNYKYRYYFKVDRIAAGTATNHYTSSTLYDDTSATEAWGSIKVVTLGASYTAYVYSDAAWTTEVTNSGSQASGQNDYLSSVGHGIGVRPLGDQNPGETDQIDYWYTSYVATGDSVGVMLG